MSVINEFENHMGQYAQTYGEFYCGIASDPKQRVYNDHNVDSHDPTVMIKSCNSSQTARDIEKYFLDKGCKGGDGGGNWQTTYVYVYKINPNTRQW